MEYRSENHMVTHPFLDAHIWRPLTERMPLWFHPNYITAFGFLSGLASCGVALLAGPLGRLSYLLAAVFLFVYLASDNIDGQFARLSGKSSDFGGFLDHFLDSTLTVPVIIMIGIVMRLNGLFLFVLVISVGVAFAATIWEQMETGVWHAGRRIPASGLERVHDGFRNHRFGPDLRVARLQAPQSGPRRIPDGSAIFLF